MRPARASLVWAALIAALGIPIVLAAASPFLEWRDWIYIAGGFAGIAALGLLLIQPLLIAGFLPGLSPYRSRLLHRWIGGVLVAALIAHVAGLWITSPPDMADALLFRSPTPFSPFGVVAMWAVFAVAALAFFRRRLGLRKWRVVHLSLAVVIVVCTVVHAVLIEGAMETISKAALCALVVIATGKVILDVWARNKKPAR
ncbi:MAG TPA: ferric reductase-like transmembrane domain-containing protein [Pseudolabrys sp.]|nr:ferric reductase-like transmembrane domain-containing protein [Pseudolabrys sp.]